MIYYSIMILMKGAIMLKYSCFVFCMLLSFSAATAFGFDPLSPKLNGTWANETMTVTIDVDRGTYSGFEQGIPFKNRIKILDDGQVYVIYEITSIQGTSQVYAQIVDGNLIETRKTGSPTVLYPPQ